MRRASIPASSRSRICTGPHEWICAAPGLLAEADDGHLRDTALDRTLEARVRLDPVDGEDAIGAGGVQVEVQRHAVGGGGDDLGRHRRPHLGADGLLRDPEVGEHRPLTLGSGPAVAAHRRHDERLGAEARAGRRSCRGAARPVPVSPRLPAPTATVIPAVTSPASVATTASRAAPSTSATGSAVGIVSSTSWSSGTVIDGSNGRSMPDSWSHPMGPTVPVAAPAARSAHGPSRSGREHRGERAADDEAGAEAGRHVERVVRAHVDAADGDDAGEQRTRRAPAPTAARWR